MTAFVVGPATRSSVPRTGERLNIFPGSATPAVFAAGAPFWVGYGFVPGPDDPGVSGKTSLDRSTRFELDVDGEPTRLSTDLTREGKRTVSKLLIADFELGLPPGWHRFTGRWYVAGKLVLSSEASIEFVEP